MITRSRKIREAILPDRGQQGDFRNGEAPADPEIVDDAVLFTRYREGDQEAFLELFDRHADRIARFCYRMIGQQDLAQDVAQDVWVKLLGIAQRGEQNLHNPAGMLFTIARNLSLNAIRDRRDHTPLDALSEEYHPQTEVRELSNLEELAIRALDRLPLDQREILILHAYSDYSFEEIGDMIGESAGTVRMRAYRARKKMKRVLSALIEFEENREGDRGVTKA